MADPRRVRAVRLLSELPGLLRSHRPVLPFGPRRPARFPARVRFGVRARVLTTVLALTAVAMTLAGTIALLAELRQHRDHVDRTLAADVQEFRALAASRHTRTDGRAITNVKDLLSTALQQMLASQGETFLGVVDRTVMVTSADRAVRLEKEPPLMDAVHATEPSDPVVIQEVSTAKGPVRLAVVPARMVGDPRLGLFVIAYPMQPGRDEIAANARTYALVSGGCLALVGLIGWLVAGRLLRPLRLLRGAAEHISHTDLSLRIPVTGNDDVTELTRTVNEMLDRLQAAFETQQHFLDDAGHELRTPLTIVRGHLEVLDTTDPREVADVRGLVLDELDRMSRLVGDLILLARARRPDFVRPAPLDLDRLVDEVADKAAALGPRRWTVDERPGITIVADPQRLTQALLQLADNAVRHTVPGDEIGIGAAVDPSNQLRLWVRDTGSGVRPEDAVRIFERFGRAASGRGDDGSGLGLAIVSAIAAAHGGRVTLDSVHGRGATFTLLLPVRPVRPTEPTGIPFGTAVPVLGTGGIPLPAGRPGPQPGANRSWPTVPGPALADPPAVADPSTAPDGPPAGPSAPGPVPVPPGTAEFPSRPADPAARTPEVS